MQIYYIRIKYHANNYKKFKLLTNKHISKRILCDSALGYKYIKTKKSQMTLTL